MAEYRWKYLGFFSANFAQTLSTFDGLFIQVVVNSEVEVIMWFLFLPESTGVYTVSNAGTFGESEVALTQLVVDGVKLLVNMEKILEKNGDIDELVPSQK